MPPITHYKGKDAVYRWELTDHRNALADLSEAQAISFTVKEQVTDADEHILFEKTLGDGITIVDDGSIDVTIVGADTAGIATETAHLVYDLQVVTKSGQVRVVEHDTFTLALPVKQGTPT